MFKREYYFLVAGLPELVLEQSKLPFSLVSFRDHLRYHLHPDDYLRVRLALLPADNRNLLLVLNKKNLEAWDQAGHYEPADFEAALRDPRPLPSYMRFFIEAFQQEVPILPGVSWENQLTQLYFDYALSKSEGLLSKWFSFNRDLDNILVALTARRHQSPLEGQLIGDYHLTDILKTSKSYDFGLSTEYPFLGRLLQLQEQEDWLERERDIANLRWNYLNELNVFNYFTVEVLLGFLLRLSLIERWVAMQQEEGQRVFEQLIQEQKKRFEFPKEFTLP